MGRNGLLLLLLVLGCVLALWGPIAFGGWITSKELEKREKKVKKDEHNFD